MRLQDSSRGILQAAFFHGAVRNAPDNVRVSPDGNARQGRASSRTEGNARLTASVAVVIFVLVAAEGVTILRIGRLLAPHVFVGMLLVPPILLKMGSTFLEVRSLLHGGCRLPPARSPPAWPLRLLGPVVVLLTLTMFVSGIALLLGPFSWRSTLLFLHRVSFIAWLGVMALHVFGHLVDTARLAPRDWVHRTRRQVEGTGGRQWAIAASVAIGLILAVAVVPQVGPWLNAGPFESDEQSRLYRRSSFLREGRVSPPPGGPGDPYGDRLPLAVDVERSGPPPALPSRRRSRRTIGTLLAALVIWLAISLGGALTNPALGCSLSSRVAEWARGHGASGVVNWVETEWYSHHPPKVGGKPPAGAIRRPPVDAGGGSTTGPAHLPVPSPIATGQPGPGR